MSRTLQFKRYANTVVANTTGAAGELIVDTTNNILTIHDGVTRGGHSAVSGADTVARTSAQAAFTQANAAFNLANTESSQTFANASFDTANSASLYANGAFIQANASFIKANTPDAIANSSAVYANGAFIAANTADTKAINSGSYANSAFTTANSATIYANGAFATANSKFSSAGGTITGNTTINGNLTVSGNVNFTGNVTNTTITGNTGQFFGYTSNGYNALYAGIPSGYFLEPQITVQVSSNFNGYSGVNMQNINSGANSSSDLFITSDNGTINDGFLDLGFASSNYNYPGYSLIGKNDGYLFATGNTTTGGGNMIVGTGLNNDVIFSVGGINTTNEIGRFKYNTGLVLKNLPITFADATSQNTSAAPFATTNASFLQANSSFAQANAAFAAANVAANTIPQNPQSGNYVLQSSDAGKFIYYTQGTNVNLYIPNSGQSSFSNGQTIMIVSKTTSSANVTITPNTGVSLYLAGNTSTSSRNVTTYGMATLIQVASNTWFINGTGVV
jgi:hypothetical protein